MSSAVRGIAVNLTASIAGFAQGMVTAAGTIGTIRGAFDKATDSAAAYKAMTGSMGEFRLAGRETIESVQTALAVARGELRKFAANSDVQVAVEIGREFIGEAWIKARSTFQRLADSTGIKVGAAIVSDKTQDLRGWLDRQRKALTKPIAVRVEIVRRAVDTQLAAVRDKLESFKQYRAVRITLAAINATKMPVQAALATLGPLRKLATTGLVVALRATHFGIAAGVTKARAMLGGLSSFGRSVTSGLSSGFALVGAGLAALGVYSFGSIIKSSMDAIDSLNDQANSIGMNVKALSQLSYAAKLSGSDQETLVASLGKLSNNLGDAATKGGPAADALTALGLNAQQVASMAPEDAFLKIASGMQGIQNPAQKTAIAMDLFGRSGAALIPMLGEGEEGIRALMAEADKLGASFDAVEANKIAAANDAIDRAKTTMAGAANVLAVQLAPFIELAANKFTDLATSGGGMGNKILSAFEAVVGGVAYASDYLSLLTAGFKLLQAGATLGVYAIVKSIDVLGQGIVWLANKIPGVEMEFSSFTGQLADGLLEEAAQLKNEAGEAFGNFMDGANSKAASKFFSDLRTSSTQAAEAIVANTQKGGGAIRDFTDEADALKKVSDAMKGLQSDVSTFGLGDVEKEIIKLKELGATDEQLQQAKGLLTLKDQLSGLSNIDTGDALGDYAAKLETLTKLWGENKIGLDQFNSLRDQAQTTLGDKLADQAKSVIDSVKTPLDAYSEELTKLQTLLDQDLITQDIFDKAQAKAKATLDAATKDDSLQLIAPKALRGGTAEAQRLAYDNARGVQKSMSKDEVAKKQLTTQEQMADSLTVIARNTKTGAALQEVDL